MEFDIDKFAELVAKHGFPIVSAIGMAWFVYYVWTWATTEIKPILSQANISVIDLLDRIRRLDNDIIRLHEKIDVAVQSRQRYEPRKTDKQESEKNSNKPQH
jgi:hypothetical protein